MDDYTSLAGPSIVMPPGGKVSGLSAKRKIGDKKKQKRDGKEEREKGKDDVIIHGRVREPPEEKQAGPHQVAKEKAPEDEDTLVLYGKRRQGKRQKSRIDLMI